MAVEVYFPRTADGFIEKIHAEEFDEKASVGIGVSKEFVHALRMRLGLKFLVDSWSYKFYRRRVKISRVEIGEKIARILEKDDRLAAAYKVLDEGFKSMHGRSMTLDEATKTIPGFGEMNRDLRNLIPQAEALDAMIRILGESSEEFKARMLKFLDRS